MSISIQSSPARLRTRRFPDHTVLTLVVAAFFVAAITMPAVAEILVVHPNGSGDYPTIQDAVSAAVDGDVIELGDGVFSGPGNSEVWGGGDNVFRSASGNPSVCVVDLGDEGTWGWHGGTPWDHVTLRHEGITFRNGRFELGDGGPSPNYGVDYTAENCVYEVFILGLARYVWSTMTNCSFWEAPVYISVAATFEGCTFVGPVETTWPSGQPGISGRPDRLTVENCVFNGFRVSYDGAAIRIQGGGVFQGHPWVRINNSVFVDNYAGDTGGAIAALDTYAPAPSLVIENCTFHGNGAAAGSVVSSSGSVSMSHCLITGGSGGTPVDCTDPDAIEIVCSSIYGNEGGDWVGCLAGLDGQDGNLSLDPCYCDAGAGDLHLCADSWALPGQHPAGCEEVIGALGSGCGACDCAGIVSTEARSWSAVKEMFR